MLKQRVITALVLAAVFIVVLWFTPAEVFTLFAAGISIMAAWEWANLCHLAQRWQRAAYVAVLVVLGMLTWLGLHHLHWFSLQYFLALACLWWTLALLWVQGYPSSAILWGSGWMRMLMGVCVLLPAWVALVAIRDMPHGQFWVLVTVLLVAVADIGAYFSGKAFGRHKLAPKVSPGKSWEGVVGGMIAVMVLGMLIAVSRGLPWWGLLAAFMPAAAVSVLGDLLESMLKRHRGIKDSGDILPGHGGVLDRIDGLVAAAPVFALALLVMAR